MNIKVKPVIKPVIKHLLPTLAIASLTFSTAMAKQNKTNTNNLNKISDKKATELNYFDGQLKIENQNSVNKY